MYIFLYIVFWIIDFNFYLFLGNDDVFCECKKKEIKCKGILGFDTLKNDFMKAEKNCDATKLRISNSHLYALPDELIFGINITEIKIESTYLPFLAAPIGNENPFFGGTLLEKFSVETVIILIIDYYILQNLVITFENYEYVLCALGWSVESKSKI